MIYFLMTFDPARLTHVRRGHPDAKEVLIAKAKDLQQLYPYITDETGHAVWVHPDCIEPAIRHCLALMHERGETAPRGHQNRARASIDLGAMSAFAPTIV